MKKTIITTSLLLVAATTIISCKKSSSGPSFVGSWEATSQHSVTVDSTVTPYATTTHDTTFVHGHSTVLDFVNNDSVVLIIQSNTPPISTPANYIYSNNKLILFTSGSIEGEIFGYSLSGNTLLLTENNNEVGDHSSTSTITFTRQ